MLQLKLYLRLNQMGGCAIFFPHLLCYIMEIIKTFNIEKKIVSLVFIQCKELEIYDKKS